MAKKQSAEHVDGYDRWRQRYPQFPGVAECVRLLHNHNTRGEYLEALCADLAANAAAAQGALFDAFRSEDDNWVKDVLIGAIVEAQLPVALPLFIEHLRSEDHSLRHWAVHGLAGLGTKEARTALWEARSLTFPDPEETADLCAAVDDALAKLKR